MEAEKKRSEVKHRAVELWPKFCANLAGTLAVKSQHVKSYLWIFVNCLVGTA